MSLTEALHYPLQGNHWTRGWLIGGALLLLWPLVLPAILALGYLVQARRAAPALPAWQPLRPLLRDGARLAVVLLAYGWPALLSLATLPAGALFLGGPWSGSRLGPWLLAIADTLQPVGLLWLPVTFLLAPLLLARAADAASLAQALSPRRLLRLLRHNAHRLPGLWSRQAALAALSLLGLAVALVGFPFALFWALLAAAYLTTALEPSPR
ncbi:MAG: DUF4013 domain-containing protein [Anaerolineae bacterium]